MAYLQQIDASGKAVKIMVIRYLRELVYQIKHELAYTSGSGSGLPALGLESSVWEKVRTVSSEAF
eukprot:1934388-Heterocapsa_arctica.AAC.1